MIVIGRSIVLPHLADDTEPFFKTKQEVLALMTSNQEVYMYQSLQELSFDLNFRVNLILSCIELFNSGIQFRTFEASYCNEVFWKRTRLGGFQLKPGALPSSAIRDIFKNGKKYGTECATAMIVLIYKALLSVYSEEIFNRLFANLLLYTWDYDRDLQLITKTSSSILPGDLVYFKNPQVNPAEMHWQGENTIYLGDTFYYGHGVGIRTKKQVIDHLNKHRIPAAFLSAYLTDLVTRLDYRTMSQYASPEKLQTKIALTPIRDDAVIATIGHTTSVY